jgi:hypothetical protein
MAFPDKTISYPFGEMDVQAPAYAATIDLAVVNQKTLVNVAQLTGAVTINAVADAGLRKGAELIISTQSDGTARAVTLGTGFKGVAISGTISKTKVATFVFDGSLFVNTGLIQVD